MSADDWRECPYCIEELKNSRNEISDDGDTVRIDYEYWFTDQKTLKMSFSGECQVCGASWSFEHEEKRGSP